MKECILKLQNRKAYITGKEKVKGNILYIQLLVPWNDKQNKMYYDIWGTHRLTKDVGRYGWYRKIDIKVT